MERVLTVSVEELKGHMEEVGSRVVGLHGEAIAEHDADVELALAVSVGELRGHVEEVGSRVVGQYGDAIAEHGAGVERALAGSTKQLMGHMEEVGRRVTDEQRTTSEVHTAGLEQAVVANTELVVGRVAEAESNVVRRQGGMLELLETVLRNTTDTSGTKKRQDEGGAVGLTGEAISAVRAQVDDALAASSEELKGHIEEVGSSVVGLHGEAIEEHWTRVEQVVVASGEVVVDRVAEAESNVIRRQGDTLELLETVSRNTTPASDVGGKQGGGGAVDLTDGAISAVRAQVDHALAASSEDLKGRIEDVGSSVVDQHHEAIATHGAGVGEALAASTKQLMGHMEEVGRRVTDEQRATNGVYAADLGQAVMANAELVVGRVAEAESNVVRRQGDTLELLEVVLRNTTAPIDVGEKQGGGGAVDLTGEAILAVRAQVDGALAVSDEELKGHMEVVGNNVVDQHGDAIDEHETRVEQALVSNREAIRSLTPYIGARAGNAPISMSQTTYPMTGYVAGRFELSDSQREWLTDFSKTITYCGNERPQFTLVGYSSAEEYFGELPFQYNNLCKHKDDSSGDIDSDRKNCYLANLRLGHVISFIAQKTEELERKQNPHSFSEIVQRTLEKMNDYCETPTRVLEFPPYINARPWCKVGQMKSARFHIPLQGTRVQPHFLNRSVHIEFDKVTSCPGF